MTSPRPVASRRLGRRPVLTAEIVSACRTALADGSGTIASMARDNNVHATTMRMACRGVTWRARDPLCIPVPPGMSRIPGYSAYFADCQGSIYSVRQSDEMRLLQVGPSGRGYKVFIVPDGSEKGQTAQVHDLVCAAWHGERPDGARVAHADGDRRNNAATNLSWASDAPRHSSGTSGESHGRAKLKDSDVLEILAHHAAGERAASIARHKGVHPTTVSGIVQRRLWRHVAVPETGLPAVAALAATCNRIAPSGATHGRAKLDEERVDRIRMLSEEGWTNVDLAKQYGVHPTTVARILKGHGWKQVTI